MMSLTHLMKRLTLGAMLSSMPLVGGCADTLTWQEEVKLSDGRVIVVTQKRRYESAYSGHGSGASSIPREFWLTFKLPEFGNKDIVWHEKLKPRILNLHSGKLYIVGFPPTGHEFYLYGKPKPSYLGFRYEGGSWIRIPFAEIPVAIYDTNMWIENAPPNTSGRISLADKAKEMQDQELDKLHKRIDPNFIMINF